MFTLFEEMCIRTIIKRSHATPW